MIDQVLAFAPGRVELLGNHTDYNEGLVLSAAIHLGVTVLARTAPQGELRITSSAMSGKRTVPITQKVPLREDAWINYPLGVVRMLHQQGLTVPGAELEIASDLPVGAGLSSSAALEVATALALAHLFGFPLAGMELAKLCQRAENEFVGVQCGLLDQASSVFGKLHELIQLDFREITARNVPMPAEAALLVINSGVPHQLTGGEYNERRNQCAEAAQRLGVNALRDATSMQVEQSNLPDLLRRRALHITGEDERVLEGSKVLQLGDLAHFGQLMFASQASSRDNFENSTSHLDTLVAIAAETSGVYGSRLSGGGFGGSTVSLVDKKAAPAILEQIASEYLHRTGARCQGLLTEASAGARIVG